MIPDLTLGRDRLGLGVERIDGTAEVTAAIDAGSALDRRQFPRTVRH